MGTGGTRARAVLARFFLAGQRLGGEAITAACLLRLMRPDSLLTGTLKSLPLSV